MMCPEINFARLMMFLHSYTFCCVVGDILIFMPGQEDIEVTCDLITG